jgi:F-type H+-transporting ATPase subunit delta
VAKDVAIARRYAQALFMAAEKKNAIDAIDADMKAVLGLDRASNDGFRLMLEAPQVPTEHKFAILETVLRPRVHPLVVEFFKLIMRKKRTFELRDVVEEFERLVEDHRGIVRARVTSAVPLTDEETRRLVAELEGALAKKVRVVQSVEPEILGGLVVRVGDRIADKSIRSMLTRLRDQLLGATAS